MATKKYTIKKYNGDDDYSWAVFKSSDVKGMGSQIFYGDAVPIMAGLSRTVAIHERDLLNDEYKGTVVS